MRDLPLIKEGTRVLLRDLPLIKEGTRVLLRDLPLIKEGTRVLLRDLLLIKEGTRVLLRDFTSYKQKWKDSQVLKQLTDRSYSVVSQGQVLRRTRRHLIPQVVPEDVDHPTTSVVPQTVPGDVYHPTASLPPQANLVEVDLQSVNSDPQEQETVTTKSGRLVKKSVWYKDYMFKIRKGGVGRCLVSVLPLPILK